MTKFLSCDWGTTAFRLKTDRNRRSENIEEQSSKQGIAATFQLWQQSVKP